MNYGLQVVTIPVADVDRSLAYYRDGVGFPIDVDYAPNDRYRVVQVTPPRSACSIQFGTGLTDATPGSSRMNYIVVDDVLIGRRTLEIRGIEVGQVFHKALKENWAGEYEDGVDPDRRDYASFVDFADPDGNTWRLQEIGHGRTSDETDD